MEGSFSGGGGGVGAKRIPCRHWSKGNCNLGASCKFLHLGPAGTGPGHLRATTTAHSSGPSTAAQTAFQQAQAAAFTIGQSMGVPAPSYNLGAAGAPAAPGRVKTVICKKYDKPEGCPYGERCTFAHGQHELGTQSKSNPMYKTVLCEQFKEAEYCERGPQCNFAHGTDELRTPGPGAGGGTFKLGYKSTLCRNWATGQCTYGASCQFAHGEGELRRDNPGNGMGPPMIGPQGGPGGPGRMGPSYKTSICKSWAESGSCQYGGACLFAHGEGEKRSEGQQFKTSLCKNWESSGTCQWGDQCKWAHGREDLRTGGQGGPRPFGGGGGGPGPGGPAAWAGSSGQYKTVLCSKWGQGLCTYGTKCMFAHGTNELRSSNGGGGGQPKVTSPQYKTVLCQQFMEGNGCQFGESCSFAHGHGEVRNVQMNLAALNPNYKGSLCKYFMTTGECEFGSICQYAHGNMELRRNPSMGGMPGPGMGGMGGGGNQNYSHMGAAGAGPSSPQWKTTLCKNYQEDGRCEFGARCQFAHGQLELRTLAQNYLQLNPQYKTILCSHFAEGGSGNCPQGNNCQFSHGPHELRMHQGHPGPQDYGQQQSAYGHGTGYGNGYGGGSKPAQQQQQNSGKPVKVVLCERFSQGHCDRGPSCQFAHGLQELHMYRARQRMWCGFEGGRGWINNNWIPARTLQKVPNYKTTLCKSWSAAPGSCEYGETCMYAHGASELRSSDGKDRRGDTGQQEPDSKRMRM